MAMALTESSSKNHQTFREEGLVTLSGVLDHDKIGALHNHFWDEVEQRFAIQIDDHKTWFANPHNPAGGSRGRRLSGMNPVMDRLRSNGRLDVAETAIQSQLDELFGIGRWEPRNRWYSLVSFPGSESQWSVPKDSWHNDEPIVVGDSEPWSIFAFVFLDRVDRQTGPTVAITGSHRRGELIAAEKGLTNGREIRAFDHVNSGLFPNPFAPRLLPVGELLPELSATDEWFGQLVDTDDHASVNRFMHQGTTNMGIRSRVVDLSADAGDVILLDPRCLHTASANVSDRPRQVLRIDFRRAAP